MQKPLNQAFPDRVALVEGEANLTYEDLEQRIGSMASGLLAGSSDLQEERIAFLLPASADYVVALHGVWRAGGIAVPLNVAATELEWEHCLSSTGVTREHKRLM